MTHHICFSIFLMCSLLQYQEFLKESIFDSNSEVTDALDRILGDIEETELKKAIQKWFMNENVH